MYNVLDIRRYILWWAWQIPTQFTNSCTCYPSTDIYSRTYMWSSECPVFLMELTIAIESLCNATATPPPNNHAEWSSLPLEHIGVINLRHTNTQSFLIPSTVPDTAKEILIYIYLKAGTSQNAFTHVKVFTEESHERRFEKYLAIEAYRQSAHTYTVDNMWFPVTQNRRIYMYVKVFKALSGNVGGNLYVICYRC